MARTRGVLRKEVSGVCGSLVSLTKTALSRLSDPNDVRCASTVAIALCVWELLLCLAIIHHVPYTEIDWRAYMDEVGGFLAGERDYTKLKGDTGPLVYPAGFVYLYGALKYFLCGGGGINDMQCANDSTSILKAQYFFAVLYVIHLGITMATYIRTKTLPPWSLGLLTLSKRLHSIFVLRLFNDGVASLFTHVAILFAQSNSWILCFVFLSLGTSVKMNVLLILPPALVLMVGWERPSTAVFSVMAFISVQIILGLPFLLTYPSEYFSKAFEFSRQFQYVWTVNWKFLRREVFLSKKFAYGLLVCHLVLLFAFAHRKWYRVIGKSNSKNINRFFWHFFFDWFARVPKNELPRSKALQASLSNKAHILSTLHTGVFIGVTFARSLHYQFYAWYFFSVPWLLWRCSFFDEAGKYVYSVTKTSNKTLLYPEVVSSGLRVLLFLVIERSWNVFPATGESSATLFAAHLLLLAGLWFANENGASVKRD